MRTLFRCSTFFAVVLAVACSSSTNGFAPETSLSNRAATHHNRPAGNGYSVIYSFDQRYENDASEPDGPLTEDSKGNLWGTSASSGLYYGKSTVFEIMLGGSVTDQVIHKFGVAAKVAGGVVIGPSGTVFGVSTVGPTYGCTLIVIGCGFVFKLVNGASGWTETIIHTFTGGSDGAFPSGGLLLSNGVLYGVTRSGGGKTCAGSDGSQCGTVYKISTSGTGYKVLHSFGGDAMGNSPSGPLIEVNGVLFGTAEFGGPAQCYNNNGCGVVYSMNPDGSGYSVVHDFSGAKNNDGAAPQTGVAFYNGKIYGTTTAGGDTKSCTGYPNNGCGTIFSTNTSGSTFKVLYSLPAAATGEPYSEYPSSLVADSSGLLYGTTMFGGDTSSCPGLGCGTLFEFNPTSGSFVVLHKFHGALSNDGDMPEDSSFDSASALVLNTSGVLYGTTYYGGVGCPNPSCGTAYQVSVGSDAKKGRGHGIVFQFRGK